MKQIIITETLLDTYRSDRGGWTKDTIMAFGVSWPLKKGWRRRLIGSAIDADKLPPARKPIAANKFFKDFFPKDIGFK